MDFEEKLGIIGDFLKGGTTYDTMVILSRDESDDITAANEAIRRIEEMAHNIILCIGADSPIIITPKAGIAPHTRTLLLVDGVPDTWSAKENVRVFEAAATSAAGTDLVNVKKIE